MKHVKIAIVTGGYFPVPPSKGGAVEALVQSVIEQNETYKRAKLVIYSCDDAAARRQAETYRETEFHFIHTPIAIRVLDRITYFIARNVLRKKKHMSYRYIFQRLHFIHCVGVGLSRERVGRVVFENHPTLLMAMRVRGNGRRYAGRCVYHMHNVMSPGFFGCKKELITCRRVLGVSRYTLDEFKTAMNGDMDGSRMTVLRNRVDETVFTGHISDERRAELRHRHDIPNNARIVLFGGRLEPGKGALQLIEAMNKLTDRNVVLLVLGSYYYGSGMKSEYETRLAQAARTLGRRIIFTGFVPHEEMPDYYALADVVCAPSIWQDSAPLAVIEPLTAGRPLVTTQMGGIPEYATDGVDAIVLPVDDSLTRNLARSIQSILDGDVTLHRNPQADWHVASYYDDFIRLVEE